MTNAKSPAEDGNQEEQLKNKNDVEKFEKLEDDGTPFSWINDKIDKNCSWNEFQKATRGSNKNKAEAYYKYTGRTKEFRAREEYMGATPQKDSPTGREVIKRMYKKNPSMFSFPEIDLKGYEDYIKDDSKYITDSLPDKFLDYVKYDGEPLTNYDMGHISPHDAVLEWNNVFSKLGEEEGKELARKWMNDPKIYELQLKSKNRSAGAKLGHTENGRYKSPETDADKIKVAKEKHKDKINEINERNKKIKENRNKAKKEKITKRKDDI